MIPEPHKTYVLELLAALGPAADDFVLTGARALRFITGSVRPTRDFDFVLDAYSIARDAPPIVDLLGSIGYTPVEESKYFQFQKAIPGSREVMRIEFLAPEELAKGNDIRVKVQPRLHGRSLKGGSITLRETEEHTIDGKLPNGRPFTTRLRVVKPAALVMLKIFAVADRLANIRGARHREHDRNEAAVHAADVVAILRAQADIALFAESFGAQFSDERSLRDQAYGELSRLFSSTTSPGLLLYEERLRSKADADGRLIEEELDRVESLVVRLITHLA